MKKLLYFLFLFSVLLILFRRAFSIDFFLDDFFFLKIGHAATPLEIVSFFWPIKDYFYRPIPTDLFYYFINAIDKNLFIIHSVIFGIYFIGLYFLREVTEKITKSRAFSFLFTFLYAIHFTHVFQLYSIATAIEIFLFTFLTISFFFFLKKRYSVSLLFFIFALMSKETAALFPVALFIFTLLTNKKEIQKTRWVYGFFFFVTLIFLCIYTFGVSNVLMIDTYQLHLNNPRLIINNLMWYLFWSLGLPNFLPNYVQSIFLQPVPDFWKLFQQPFMSWYIGLLLLHYACFIPLAIAVLIEKRKQWQSLVIPFVILMFFFIFFIAPTVPIVHRWMVRLTIPVLFIVAIEVMVLLHAWKMSVVFRSMAIIVCILYISLHVVGVSIHESSGLFLRDSQFVARTKAYLLKHKSEVLKSKTLYVAQRTDHPVGSSIELKNLLGDQYFVQDFFPGHQVRVLYQADGHQIPPHAFVIIAEEFEK